MVRGVGPDPTPPTPRHTCVPVEVRTAITEDLVGWICSECLEACPEHPRPEPRPIPGVVVVS